MLSIPFLLFLFLATIPASQLAYFPAHFAHIECRAGVLVRIADLGGPDPVLRGVQAQGDCGERRQCAWPRPRPLARPPHARHRWQRQERGTFSHRINLILTLTGTSVRIM